ncbi:hypothetical protein, unknown function [Leishmania tarentolae]|uniref:MSP domain-containing protein n=1 Tax=Leishmania tarentolae TaxID=5689 RepID=A0A640KEF8_LEITA|nr:hypothetical protein, unknown function [Leishmania tarentolae]
MRKVEKTAAHAREAVRTPDLIVCFHADYPPCPVAARLLCPTYDDPSLSFPYLLYLFLPARGMLHTILNPISIMHAQTPRERSDFVRSLCSAALHDLHRRSSVDSPCTCLFFSATTQRSRLPRLTSLLVVSPFLPPCLRAYISSGACNSHGCDCCLFLVPPGGRPTATAAVRVGVLLALLVYCSRLCVEAEPPASTHHWRGWRSRSTLLVPCMGFSCVYPHCPTSISVCVCVRVRVCVCLCKLAVHLRTRASARGYVGIGSCLDVAHILVASRFSFLFLPFFRVNAAALFSMESRYSLQSESTTAEPTEASHVSKSYSPSPRLRSWAAKMHTQIKIEPSHLVFPPPHFGRCIQNAISIYNVSKQPCVFKMRSQNPERYVAKPHIAIVAPESATRSFVTLRDMNTLGMKSLPEETQDRFRFSLKFYDPRTVDPSVSARDMWNLLTARDNKVDHEQDLIAYFTKKDTPVGGLVTFFPPTYIPVIPSVAPNATPLPTTATALTSARASSSAATRHFNNDGGAVSRLLAASGAVKEWAKAATTTRGLWFGVIVAVLMALSVTVAGTHIWGAGDAGAGRAQATAARGRPAPYEQRGQADRADSAAPLEPPSHHAESVVHHDVPAAESAQAYRHQQHHGEHQSGQLEATASLVDPPYEHPEAPPVQEEVHHEHREKC